MIAMVEDLKKFPLSAIENAFRKWRQTKSQVPTPAEIIKLVDAQTAEGRKGIKKFQDFGGTWQEYKAYLDEHGLLSPNLKAF